MTITRRIITDISVERETGSSAIAKTLVPAAPWQFEEIRIHLSAAGGADDLTMTINHGTAAAYDVVILTQDMTSVVDFVWAPDEPMKFAAGDELDIAWANAGGRTYGLEIVWQYR